MISVIIPTYNMSGLLGNLLSVLDSFATPLEIIVVDDGSTDDTSKLEAKYSVYTKHRLKWIRQSNQGPSAARNAGMAIATGDWLHFHDVDDLVQPEFYTEGLRLGSTRPEIDVWVCARQEVDMYGNFLRIVPQKLMPEESTAGFHELLLGSLGPPICYLVRRSAALQAGTWRVGTNYAEDWEWWMRVAACGGRFAIAPHHFALYRDSPGSLSKQTVRMYLHSLEAMRLALEYHPGCKECREAITQSIRDIRNSFCTAVANEILQRKFDLWKSREVRSVFARDRGLRTGLFKVLLKRVIAKLVRS